METYSKRIMPVIMIPRIPPSSRPVMRLIQVDEVVLINRATRQVTPLINAMDSPRQIRKLTMTVVTELVFPEQVDDVRKGSSLVGYGRFQIDSQVLKFC